MANKEGKGSELWLQRFALFVQCSQASPASWTCLADACLSVLHLLLLGLEGSSHRSQVMATPCHPSVCSNGMYSNQSPVATLSVLLLFSLVYHIFQDLRLPVFLCTTCPHGKVSSSQSPSLWNRTKPWSSIHYFLFFLLPAIFSSNATYIGHIRKAAHLV